jgi:hypothetical protein
MTRSALAGALAYTRSIAAESRRSDMAVLALGCLGVGNLWARRGASGGYTSGWALVFIVGFGLIVAAGALCYLAVGRPPGRPHAVVCAVAIGMQTLGPTYVMSAPLLWVTGLVLAAVPLIRHARAAWVPVIVGAALIVWATVSRWSWGNAIIDVFAEVQGSTQALIHGQNPYSPLYSIYLDSPLHHIVYGAASFNYGPAVVLLSVPARLIGDVRVTMVALNLSILVAALLWLRRGEPGGHLEPTLVALWVVSPFIPLMILNAWTDSVSMACAVWWLLLRDRHRNWSIAFLALALASKPTFVPIVIPLVFWVRTTWREFLWATSAALVIVAPFALWTGIPQFVYDTITIYNDLPTRRDSVGFDGLSAVLGHGLLPASFLLAGTLVTLVVFTLRRPRDYADLLLLGSGMLIVVCFFVKQAFLNYDYSAAIALLFVIGAGTTRPLTPLTTPLHDLRLFGDRIVRLRRSGAS